MKTEIKRHSLHKLLFTVPQYSIHNKNLLGEDENAYSGLIVILAVMALMGVLISPFVLDPIPTHPLFWIMYSAMVGGIGYFACTKVTVPQFSLELNKPAIYVGDEVIAKVICDEKALNNKILEYKVTLVLQEKTGFRRFAENSAYRYHYYYEEVVYQSNTINNVPIHFMIPKHLPPSVVTNSIQKVNHANYKKTKNKLMQDLGLTTDLSEGTDIFLEWALVIECKLKYKRTVRRTYYFSVLAPETENEHDSKNALDFF